MSISPKTNNTHWENEQKVAEAMRAFELSRTLENKKALAVALRTCALGYIWGQQGKFDIEKTVRTNLEAAKYL